MLLKVLTWNIEGRGLSAAAPSGYSDHSKRQAIIRHITRHSPDIVALQEIFDLAAWSEALAQHRYKCIGGVYSHCGATTLFFGERCICLKDDGVGPSICAEIKVSSARKSILVAGCHLQPFKEGTAQRLLQLRQITQAAASWTSSLGLPQPGSATVPAAQAADARQAGWQRSRSSSGDHSCSSRSDSSEESDSAGHRRKKFGSPGQRSQVPAANCTAPASLQELLPVLIVGDMNMREAETTAVTDPAGLGLSDAYLTAAASGTASANAKNTWDTRCNRYYDEGFKYACRYDRVFCKGAEWAGVRAFELVGHMPEHGVEGFYLSDHFGIVATLDVCLD